MALTKEFQFVGRAIAWLVRLLVGLVIVGLGVFIVKTGMNETPVHSPHVYVGIGVAIFGALLIEPDPVLDRIQKVVVILSPWLPTWGRRSTDVAPPPPGVAPGTPINAEDPQVKP